MVSCGVRRALLLAVFQLVQVGKAAGRAQVYLMSVSVIGEDYNNSNLPEILRFAKAQQAVGKAESIPVIDSFERDVAYDTEYNCLNMKGNVLNGGSGVHPKNPPGARLLANAHAEGILAALKPGILSPLKTDDVSHTSDPPPRGGMFPPTSTTAGTAATVKPHIVFVMADGACLIRWLLTYLGCTTMRRRTLLWSLWLLLTFRLVPVISAVRTSRPRQCRCWALAEHCWRFDVPDARAG